MLDFCKCYWSSIKIINDVSVIHRTNFIIVNERKFIRLTQISDKKKKKKLCIGNHGAQNLAEKSYI